MIHANITDLSGETRGRLLASSKVGIKRKYGKDSIEYSSLNNVNLDRMLEEEAIRILCSYKYAFTI